MFKFTVKCIGSQLQSVCNLLHKKMCNIRTRLQFFSSHNIVFFLIDYFSIRLPRLGDSSSSRIKNMVESNLPAKWEKGRCTVWSNDDVGKMMKHTHRKRSIPFHISFRCFFPSSLSCCSAARRSVEKPKWGKMWTERKETVDEYFTHTLACEHFTKEPIL